MSTSAIVVDDEPDVCEVFTEYLSMVDVDVVATGKDGLEASQLYQKHHPDVVLMDMLMPLYDGIYGLKKIKESDPNAKVVIVTASISPEVQNQLQQNGAQAIIWKPYEMEKVLEVIEQVRKGSSGILVRKNQSPKENF